MVSQCPVSKSRVTSRIVQVTTTEQGEEEDIYEVSGIDFERVARERVMPTRESVERIAAWDSLGEKYQVRLHGKDREERWLGEKDCRELLPMILDFQLQQHLDQPLGDSELDKRTQSIAQIETFLATATSSNNAAALIRPGKRKRTVEEPVSRCPPYRMSRTPAAERQVELAKGQYVGVWTADADLLQSTKAIARLEQQERRVAERLADGEETADLRRVRRELSAARKLKQASTVLESCDPPLPQPRRTYRSPSPFSSGANPTEILRIEREWADDKAYLQRLENPPQVQVLVGKKLTKLYLSQVLEHQTYPRRPPFSAVL